MARKQVDTFLLDKRIGGGSYGEVWCGRDVQSSLGATAVALRCVRRTVEAKVARLRTEVRLLRQVSHTNILRFHGLRKTPSCFYVALEYCDGGNLAQHMYTRGPLPEADSWRFCAQIVAGLLALHCESFCHGNLQPRSVLLSDSSQEPKLKLANFTLKLEPNEYTAPEVLRGEPCDHSQADMWSAGAILYEMLFGRPPFLGTSRSQLLARQFNREVNFTPIASLTGAGRAFCQSLLSQCPTDRLSSHDCANHVYIKRGPRDANVVSAVAAARRSRGTPSHLQLIPRVGNIQLAQMCSFSSARLACFKIAQCYLYTLTAVRGLAGTTGEADAEADGKMITNDGHRLPSGLHHVVPIDLSPVTHFVVGQLQYSHFFRIRTARLFPRILSI